MTIVSNTRRAFVAAAAACALLIAGAGHAAEARYADVVLTDQKDGKPKQVFPTTTERLHLSGRLVDVPSGSKVKAAWIAEKTKVAPPNYEIDAKELDVGRVLNRVDFSMSKPTAGWPVGDYRVDLSINGKVVQQVKFKVQ